MNSWRKRFEGIPEKKRDLMLQELEEANLVSGKTVLNEEELHELITLLPRDYLVQSQRIEIQNLRKNKRSFQNKVPDIENAVNKYFENWVACNSDDEREDLILKARQLRYLHPVLWYKIYKKLAAHNLSWAAEFLGPKDDKPFLIP